MVVTGQQVGLFRRSLFTPFKVATALARARQATAAGWPHAAILWLATEDHDFAEINQWFSRAPPVAQDRVFGRSRRASAVGGIILDDSITPLIDGRGAARGFGAMDALSRAYRPGRTFARLPAVLRQALPRRGCWC